MPHDVRDIRYERIPIEDEIFQSYNVFYKNKHIGFVVEDTNVTFYPSETKYPTYRAPTKTMAVGAFILKHKK